MKQLQDQVAVITGGARGLGLAIARAYAADGAAVVLAGRSQASIDGALAEFQASGTRAAGLSCDVAELAQVEALGRFAMERFGAIDIWVNNAGVSAPYGPTADIPSAAFARVVGTNITGVYNGSVVALRHMLPRGRGKLITLLGRGAERTRGVKYQNAYSSSKVWARSFTLALADEYRDSGVGIFAFNPGLVDTDLLRDVAAIDGYQERMKPLETVIRLWGNPPEVPAERAVWLASSATDGKTGLVVNVLGRRQLLGGLVRELVRRARRQPAPDTSLRVEVVPPESGDSA